METGLLKSARTALVSALAIAFSVFGVHSISAQEYHSPGQVLQNGCCPGCLQRQCRCRPRLQFVNPNQFLIESQWQDPCLPYSDSSDYPPYGFDPSSSQPMANQPGSQPFNQPGTQPPNQPGQGANNNNALAFGQGGGSEGMGFRGTPNVIGDFFSSGSSVADVRMSVRMDPFDGNNPSNGIQANFSVASSAELAAGMDILANDANGYGFNFTALNNLGDIITTGDQSFSHASDIRPSVTTLRIHSTDSVSRIDTVLAGGGGDVAAGEPIANSDFLLRVRNAIEDFAPDIVGNYDDVQRYVNIQLNPNSTLFVKNSNSFGPGSIDVTTNFIYDIQFAIPTPSPGDLVGRTTMADNNSPLPRDRVFLDFNYFHNAVFGPVTLPANRFAPGFEKTFFDGNTSIECRFPMAVTLSSDLVTNSTDVLKYQMGDFMIAGKALLRKNRRGALTAGIGVSIPTADDFSLSLSDGTNLLRIENDTVRLIPYIAALSTPNDDQFFQMFLSIDTDVSGNPVFYNPEALANGGGGNLGLEGILQSNTIARLDLSAGNWVFRNRPRRITDMAAVVEAHISTDVSDPDVINTDSLLIGTTSRSTVVNMTFGTHLYFGPRTDLTAGYGVPLTDDRGFDGELRVFMNRYF